MANKPVSEWFRRGLDMKKKTLSTILGLLSVAYAAGEIDFLPDVAAGTSRGWQEKSGTNMATVIDKLAVSAGAKVGFRNAAMINRMCMHRSPDDPAWSWQVEVTTR